MLNGTRARWTITVVLLLLAALPMFAGCGSQGPLEPYKPTGESITVTTPEGVEVMLEGEGADLYREIQYIREALESGRVKWDVEALAEMVSGIGSRGTDADEFSFLREEGSGDLFTSMFFEPINDPVAFLDSVETSLFESAELSVFMHRSASREEVLSILAEMEGLSEVASASLVTKEDALAMMKEKLRDNPELFQDLPENPFPDKIVLVTKKGIDVQGLIDRYSRVPEVDEIRNASEGTAESTLSDMLFETLRVLVYLPYYSEQIYE